MHLWGVSPYQGPPGPPDVHSLKDDGHLSELLDKALSLDTIGGAPLEDLEELATEVDGKASVVYVDAADAALTAAIALKASTAYVDAADALKASITYVNTQDALKADITYVDTQDTAVANAASSALTTGLALKLNRATPFAEIATDSTQRVARANLIAPALATPSTKSSNYCLINNLPYPAGGFTTATLIKDKWVYIPFELDADRSFNQLGVSTNTAASNGTAVAIFALFTMSGATAEPTALYTSYASYGSIDLTAAAGPLTLATVGLTILKGRWFLGVAWSGTATTSPTLHAVTGSHPSCSGVSIGTSSTPTALTGRFQSSSGSSPPNPPVAAAGGQPGVAIWGRNP